MSADKIRLGVIGCGGMTDNHNQGLVRIADYAKVTAVCDIIEERAQNAAKILGAEFVTTDYTKMVDYVDAVLVVLPHDLHYETGMFFARNKKHVLMEKPLCNSEAECLRLIKTAEEENITLMTAYPVRFWPLIVKMKEIADSKEYGEIMQMSIWTEQLTKYDELHWASTARLGGGQFFSHGCHYVDILLWFLGNPVKGVHMGTNMGTPWMLEEGTSNVTIEFESGALGYHFGTWGARGTKMGYNFQIHFEKGLLEYDRFSGELRFYSNNKDAEDYTVVAKDEQEGKKTQYEILHFLDCIKNGKTPQTNGYSSLQGLRVIWKLYEAEKNNTVADLRGLGLK